MTSASIRSRPERGPTERQRDEDGEDERAQRQDDMLLESGMDARHPRLVFDHERQAVEASCKDARRDDCEDQCRDGRHREAARLAPMFEGEPDHRRAGEPKTCSEIGARCGGPIVKEHFGGRARFPKGKRECRDEDDRRNGSATASKRGDFCKQGERDDAVRGEAERLDRTDRLPGQKPVRRHSEPCQAVDGERKGPDEACPQQIGRRRCRNPWRGNGHD